MSSGSDTPALSVPRARRALVYVAISVVALGGMVGVGLATVRGVGVTVDSTAYLNVALNVMQGRGLVDTRGGFPVPMNYTPPLYPLMLASARIFGSSPVDVARWLGVLTMGATVVLVGLLVFRRTGAVWPAVLGALLVFVSGAMTRVYAMAWTDPLFVTFVPLFVLALLGYLERPSPGRLAITAAVAAASLFTRHLGLAMVATGVYGVLFLRGGHLRGRVAGATVFTAASLAPFLVWQVAAVAAVGNVPPDERTLHTARFVMERVAAFHPVSFAQVYEAASTVREWLFLDHLPSVPGYLLLLAAAASLLVPLLLLRGRVSTGARASPSPESPHLVRILAAFVLSYLVALVISISLFDAATPLGGRILTPVYVAGAVLVCVLLETLLRTLRPVPVLTVAYSLMLLAFLGVGTRRCVADVAGAYRNGVGRFSERAWRESATMDAVRALPDSVTVFTNWPAAVWFLAGRPAQSIPSDLNPAVRGANRWFGSELSLLRSRLGAGAVLVMFTYRAAKQDFIELPRVWSLPVRLVSELPDGLIFQAETAHAAS